MQSSTRVCKIISYLFLKRFTVYWCTETLTNQDRNTRWRLLGLIAYFMKATENCLLLRRILNSQTQVLNFWIITHGVNHTRKSLSTCVSQHAETTATIDWRYSYTNENVHGNMSVLSIHGILFYLLITFVTPSSD